MSLGFAIFIVAMVYFAIISPGFRMVALACCALAIVGLAFLIAYYSHPSPAPAETRHFSYASAPPATPPAPMWAAPSQIRIEDVRVRPSVDPFGGYAYRGYDVSARLTNASDRTFPRVAGELVALDCRSAKDCTVTGRENIAMGRSFSVPGGESAQLKGHVLLDHVAPARFTRRWRIDLQDPN